MGNLIFYLIFELIDGGMEKICKKNRWVMFDSIATTYDSINRWMTFGIDIIWRKKMIQSISDSCQSLLDVATGTMDVAITAAKNKPELKEVIAMDMAQEMMVLGEEKCKQKKIQNITPVVADVHNIPYEKETFNAVTVSFGIRNFENLPIAFSEMYRVLSPNGEIVILESCKPTNPMMRKLNDIFLKYWVGLIGGFVSKKKGAYTYLIDSIDEFHSPNKIRAMLRTAGFDNVTSKFFLLKSVHLVVAKKPASKLK